MSSSEPFRRGRRTPAAIVVAGLVALATAGCGFRPLYAPPDADSSPEARAVATSLARIGVAPIPNRQGQELRNALTDRLDVGDRGAGGNRYQLNVGLGEVQQSLAIRQTGLATRANLYMFANYNLIDITTGQALVVGSTTGVASYDLLDQDFATLTAINDARTRVIARIADNIRNRLAVHFAGEADLAAAAAAVPAPVAAVDNPAGAGSLPRPAAWPDAPTPVPPLVAVPSPATQPTIASPAAPPFVAFQPPGSATSTDSPAPVGPADTRPGAADSGILP